MAPVSWRDVYDLVQASETKVLAAIAVHAEKSEEDHEDLSIRLRSLEDDRTRVQGAKAAEKKILGMARSTVAVIVAVGGLLLQVAIGILRP